MKKRLLVLLCVVAMVGGLVGPVLAADPNAQGTMCAGGCYDTDKTELYPDGKNIWEKGTVTVGGKTGTDKCVTQSYWPFRTILYEYVCDIQKGVDYIGAITYKCEDYDAVCQDGRCMKEQPAPTPVPIPNPIPTPEPQQLAEFGATISIAADEACLWWRDGKNQLNPTNICRETLRLEDDQSHASFFVDVAIADTLVIEFRNMGDSIKWIAP